jgi:predicted PurR-regulated permease PerM
MFNNKLNYKIINVTALMLLLYIGFSNIGLWWGIITKCISVLAPFIIGFAFAYAFSPLVKLLERKGIKRSIALLIVIIGLLVLISIILGITLPIIYDQLSLCINMIVEILNNISLKFNINVGTMEIKITDYLNNALKDIGAIASSTTIGLLNKSFNFISKFIVGFVGFIYFMVDMDKIREGLKSILNSVSNRLFKYIKCMDTEITNYLKGLEIFMVIQFFEYSILFFIVGHPNWLLLGVLACITTIIPYFGGLITNIIAIIMASVVSVPLVIMTTIICLIFPQLDGYFISPKVYGKTNNVNPLITIMAVSIGGTIAGITGIIVALPCYLLIRTTYNFFKMDLKKGMNIVKETI